MMTMSGAWHKLRDDPILRFLIVSLSFYGMSTFEGPMMAIKTVNALSPLYRLDHRPRAFRCLGLGGSDFHGSLYYMIPRLFGLKQMYSKKAIELHFWMATVGIVLYIASMWIAGVMEGLMWRAITPTARLPILLSRQSRLTHPFYMVRLLGGVLYLGGMVVMLWNVLKTATSGHPTDAAIPHLVAHA